MSSISAPYFMHSLLTGASSTFFVSSKKSSVIDLAASNSAISQFVLQPTPRLVSSFAISPLVEILCPSIICSSETAGATSRHALAAIQERGHKIYLRRIEESGDVYEISLGTGDSVCILGLFDKDIPVVVFRSGKIASFKLSPEVDTDSHEDAVVEGVEDEDKDTTSAAREFKQLWTANIFEYSKAEILFSEFTTQPDGTLLLTTVSRTDDTTLDIQKTEVSGSGINVIGRWSVNENKSKHESIEYHESGVVFHLTNQKLSIITIPSLKSTAIDLKPYMPEHKKYSKGVKHPAISFVPSGKTSILASNGVKLFLINWQYGTILASRELTDGDISIRLLKRVSKRAALGITNDGKLHIIPFNVGTGSLLESIRGNVEIVHDTERTMAVMANLCLVDGRSTRRYILSAQQETEASMSELTKIKEQINVLKEACDFAGLEKRIIPYLSGKKPWREVDTTRPMDASHSKKSKSKRDDTQKQEKRFTYYSPERSRQVNAALIGAIVELLFYQTPGQPLKITWLKNMRRTVAYLLSHPLFPTSQFPDLLEVFHSDSELTMVTIKRTHGLAIGPLLSLLVSELTGGALNQVIIMLTIERLEKEYSYRDIVRNLTDNYTTATLSSCTTSIFSLLSKDKEASVAVIMDNNLWNILSCFIDSTGLFMIGDDMINEMSTLVNSEIRELQKQIDVLQMVDLALEMVRKKERKSLTAVNFMSVY
ncbi:U3 small nucleolar RNA-associated protein 8 [Limtongia smithiae]|uniref:U3 small nucleolar RNA-associated protein 8 n=1 Tax=Limtongia smithiae TaxID=1125753 RepID=UPI0034CE960B